MLLQRVVGLARDAQQVVPFIEQLLRDREAHAARCAGDDGEVLGHVRSSR